MFFSIGHVATPAHSRTSFLCAEDAAYRKRVAIRHSEARAHFTQIQKDWSAMNVTQRERAPHLDPGRHVFDAYQPEWNCEDKEMVPHTFGDGHKWMCHARQGKPHQNCLIYSIGSNSEDSWERAMALLRPECEIHIFDPTLSDVAVQDMERRARRYGARFHAIGIAAVSSKVKGKAYLTLGGMMQQLGHVGRRLDILKVE